MAEARLDVLVGFPGLDSESNAAASAVENLRDTIRGSEEAAKAFGEQAAKSSKIAQDAAKQEAAANKKVEEAIKRQISEGKKNVARIRSQNKNLGDLRKQAERLEEQFEKADFGTKRFENLQKQLVEVNRQIKNTELSVEALDTDQVASEIGGLVGGIADVGTGALLSFGIAEESAEELISSIARIEGAGRLVKGSIEGVQAGTKLYNNVVKNSNTLTKINAAATSALSSVYKVLGVSVNTSSKSFGNLRKAIIATGIGALVVGVGLLIANFDKVRDAILKVIPQGVLDAFNDLGDFIVGIGESIGLLSEGTKELSTAQKEAQATQNRQNALIKEAIELGKEEVENATILIGAIGNQTISKEKQTEAYDALRRLYPEIIGQYESEQDLLNNLEQAQDAITASIARQTIERLKSARIAQLQEEIFDQQLRAAAAARSGDVFGFDAQIANARVEGATNSLRNLASDLEAVAPEIEAIFSETSNAIDLTQISSGKLDEVLSSVDKSFKESDQAAKAALEARKKLVDELKKLTDELDKQSEALTLAGLDEEGQINAERDRAIDAVNDLGEQILQAKRELNDEEAELTQEQLDQLEALRVAAEADAVAKIADIRLKAVQDGIKAESDLLSAQIEEVSLNQQLQEASIDPDISERDRTLAELDIRRSALEETAILQAAELENKRELLQLELDAIKDKNDEESLLRAEQLEQQISNNETQRLINQQNLDNQIADIEESIDSLNQIEPFSLQKLIGANDEEFDFVKDQFGSVIDSIKEGLTGLTEAQIEENQKLIDAIQSRIDETSNALNTEIALNQAGFASNVEGKREELAELQRQREEALANQEQLQRRQARLNQIQIAGESAVQAAQLITAAATLFRNGAKFFPVGVALAAGLAATLFGAFARIKQQAAAASVPQFKKGGGLMLSGPSHAAGGLGLFDMSSGRQVAEYEGGEYLYAVNGKSSKKHLGLLRAINNDQVDYDSMFASSPKINYAATSKSNSTAKSSSAAEGYLKSIDANVSKIVDTSANESVEYSDGYKIVRRGNYTKRVKLKSVG